MEVTNTNDVKIYNLSAGKSLPSFLTEKRRKQATRDINIRNRIELLQDFEMPTVSDCIKASNDGKFLIATGTYKPRVRCYDVNNLSMKFERGLDSDVVRLEILTDDYSKIVFMHCDRYVEFHSRGGIYYKTRIPKFARDFCYHSSSCTLYFATSGPEVYRLNLEQGKFMNSLVTASSSLNACKLNPAHELFVCGTVDGRVEAWDPRSRHKVGVLDCALNSITESNEVFGIPSVTSLCFRDGLNLAVGTGTGQILLYDIRSDKPLLVKDHMYGLPIKNIVFHENMDMVLSMDKQILKIWDRHTGKPFTFIEPGKDLNDLCLLPNSGLMFMANESPKILSYYIPSLGPAPPWCSFLDSLTEELEETMVDTVYDDYKFLTVKELENLGLSHLIGSNLLRAYMHGYFVDMRLYHKTKQIVEPFAFDDYRKKKIREKLDEEWANRVQLAKLPNVNKELAQKLMLEEESGNRKQKKKATSLLKDDRFKDLFENPEFEVDTQTDEYRLIKPLITQLDRTINVRRSKMAKTDADEIVGATPDDDQDDESSDDGQTWAKELKRQFRVVKNRKRDAQRKEDAKTELQPRFFALKQEGDKISQTHKAAHRKSMKISLADRLRAAQSSEASNGTVLASGNREMTYTIKTSEKAEASKLARLEHQKEREKVRRKAPNAINQPIKTWVPRK